ncbi:hybrid sensor histidine kinase/response regulator [Pedobacter sp. Hv1]|uniref:hybrid sensor histidine kinase/response regulator n=1 Tax=Pedobacter sp. Hv1 TaxID=1740090 RepID=UPI0006D8A639|nr:ATP-binding protein [Pedobacter sp. Hv1]KQB99529.1 histidine kinase [Pedobacter sp. Hv1]
MAKITQHRFLQATKGKIIMGFFLASLALLMAWAVNKIALQKILTTVENISTPNDRLRMVNKLSHQIAGLDQVQKNKALKDPDNYSQFFKESKRLKLVVDTLKKLYAKDTVQFRRLVSIQKLLNVRDRQFIEYLKVREGLVNNKSYADEVAKLNEMVSTRFRGADSTILTTKTTTSTTTLEPEAEKSKGFLSRLFGKKKAEVYKIISEELQVKRDTVSGLSEDSIIRNMEVSLKAIAQEQQVKIQRFLKREIVLANANNVLTQQMLDILKKVEAEAVAQIGKNGQVAKELVNEGISQISAIILAFFLLTGILLYFILTDISKSNRYRAALEEAKEEAEYHGKAKQRFLSNMSHEIRTPLQSILGYAQIVSQQTNPSKKDLNAIYQSSSHLLQIANEILDYNRIISGEFSFTNQSFNIHQILTEVVAVMRPLAEEKSLRLVAAFDLDDLTYINGDPFRLKQILFNLLGNAVKFTLKGEIVLAVAYKQQGAQLHFNFSISDTGIGFAKTDVDRIFNEFEQVESPEKKTINPTGTGLGLSIVKSLVEQQGGRIVAKSEEGVGTVFNFFLTYSLSEQTTVDHLNLTTQPITDTGKVWIIDDDHLILELCELIFTQQHIAFQSFDKAEAVLNAAVDEEVKYVLIDMRLPDMSGLTLYHLLKKRIDRTVKFYAITAQVLPDERESILQDGFDGLIMKPFRAEELLSIFEKTKPVEIGLEIDWSTIEKMTFGDPQLFDKIVDRFKQDCLADMSLLKKAMQNNEVQNSRLIVHRLAGRLGQIGAKALAKDFRMMELKVAADSDSGQKEEINILLVRLDQLLSSIDEKIM